MMLKMALLASEANASANRIHFYVANMTIGQYREASKQAGWRLVREVREMLDSAQDLFKEESLPWQQIIEWWDGEDRTGPRR